MIRKFQMFDLGEVMEIWLESNKSAHSFIPEVYWEQNFDAVKEMLPQAEVYVYEDENSGKTSGFIGLADNYIAGIFVRSAMRSGGIGRKLLNRVKQEYDALTLHVYRKNEGAIRFYQREEFKIREERTDGDTGEVEFLMEWEHR